MTPPLSTPAPREEREARLTEIEICELRERLGAGAFAQRVLDALPPRESVNAELLAAIKQTGRQRVVDGQVTRCWCRVVIPDDHEFNCRTLQAAIARAEAPAPPARSATGEQRANPPEQGEPVGAELADPGPAGSGERPEANHPKADDAAVHVETPTRVIAGAAATRKGESKETAPPAREEGERRGSAETMRAALAEIASERCDVYAPEGDELSASCLTVGDPHPCPACVAERALAPAPATVKESLTVGKRETVECQECDMAASAENDCPCPCHVPFRAASTAPPAPRAGDDEWSAVGEAERDWFLLDLSAEREFYIRRQTKYEESSDPFALAMGVRIATIDAALARLGAK